MIDMEQIRRESVKGYTEYSGIQITEVGEGFARGEVRIRDCHKNPSGAVHGGLIFCLGDVMGGTACRTLGARPVTVSSSISYLRPLLGDQVIYAEGRVTKAGRTTLFINVEILNEQKEVAAQVQAVYYNMNSR